MTFNRRKYCWPAGACELREEKGLHTQHKVLETVNHLLAEMETPIFNTRRFIARNGRRVPSSKHYAVSEDLSVDCLWEGLFPPDMGKVGSRVCDLRFPATGVI